MGLIEMLGMDAAEAKFWLAVCQNLLTGGVAIYVWVTTRHNATRKQIWSMQSTLVDKLDSRALTVDQRFDELERELDERVDKLERELDDRIDTHEVRITRLDTLIEKMPQAEDMEQVRQRLAAVDGNLQYVRGQISQIRQSQSRVEQHLLDRGA